MLRVEFLLMFCLGKFLKIKIFLSFLRQGVILPKDNPAKRKWKEGSECCFCNAQDTIQHLFFECPIVRLVWSIVCITFDIKKPTSINHIFLGWIKGFLCKQRKSVLLGVAAVCWAIWLGRNNVVFQRSKRDDGWSILSEEDRSSLSIGSRMLETAALEIFNNYGCNALRRIV
jgi:hypothetical protein